jgi:drug/metabolite transporter (DMT)-like permease
LKEKLSKDFYIWALLAIIAAYFLTFAQPGIGIKNIRLIDPAAVYALLAAFAFGSSTVFGKRFTNELSFGTATSLRFMGTMLLALIFVLVGGQFKSIPDMQMIHWKLLVLIVFSSGALSMFIYYFGLKRIPASVATIFELVWPLSAILLDFVINKNALNATQYIAAVFLLLSFFMIIKRKNTPQKK